jgi:4-hydroxy-tetrahydrodipicolinate synthase
MQRPHGAFAPVPTPLSDDGSFDGEALVRHLRWLAGQGLDGALILGTNGEFPSFALDERRHVAEVAASAESGLQLMLGVGSCAVTEVCEMAALAVDLGFGSLLCPPPFYFRQAPVTGLAAFFLELLDSAALSTLLYHIPQVSGVAISDELLDAIGPHEMLAGVKDSSGDSSDLRRFCTRFAEGCYMVGSDRLVTECLNAGGSGSISAAASVAPALVVGVQNRAADQQGLDRMRALLEEYGLGPSVKSILRRSGFGAYATRPPLVGLDKAAGAHLWSAFCELLPESERPTVG